MTRTPDNPALRYVLDGTRENFEQLVLDNSRRGLVIVHYWQPGAGPCMRLWHTLEALVTDYAGRFLLVNVNARRQQELAREQGVASVPTLHFYRNRNRIDTVHGPESEIRLRHRIDPHVPAATDPAVAEALRLYRQGEPEQALLKLVEAGLRRPDDVRIHATALRLLLREQRYTDIEAYVRVLPAGIRRDPAIDRPATHASLLALARKADDARALERRIEADPEASEARLQRAALACLNDDYQTALHQLAEVHHRAPGTADGLARRAIDALLELLGEAHPLAARTRALLAGDAGPATGKTGRD